MAHSQAYAIRPVRHAELPKLQSIEAAAAQLFRHTPQSWIADDEGMALATLDHWFVLGKIWVAVDEQDEPVGFAIARAVDGTAYLHELDVHPQHGRRGLGARLIDTVVTWARENDYPAVTLATCSNIPWNAPYYTRLGFRILQEDELGPGLQEVRAHELEAGWPAAERVCMIRPIVY